MSTPSRTVARPPAGRPPAGRSRLVLLVGVGIVVLYLAGAAVSGRASILARRPLLDGLAPPTPYRWVNPPPELAAANKPPASTRFTVKLQADGSRLGAFSTNDGQINLVLSEGAIPPRSGQTEAEVAVDPVDPATLGPPSSGFVVAGNAYRIQASYQPSGRKVEALGGQSSVGLVYPLLATAVANPGGHVVLSSADGRAWEQLPSTDTPGTHQVSAGLTRTGYVQVGVAPAQGGSGTDSRTRILLLGTAIAVAIVAAALVVGSATARPGPQVGKIGCARSVPATTAPSGSTIICIAPKPASANAARDAALSPRISARMRRTGHRSNAA